MREEFERRKRRMRAVQQPAPTGPKPDTVLILNQTMKSILVRHKFAKFIHLFPRWITDLMEFDTRCHGLDAMQILIDAGYTI